MLIEVQRALRQRDRADQRCGGESGNGWRASQAKIVTAYVGGRAAFYLAMGPELPDPSFAKIVVRDSQQARDTSAALAVAAGSRRRACDTLFSPSPFPVAYRVSSGQVLRIAEAVQRVMQASPMMRTVRTGWSTAHATLHFQPAAGPLATWG